MTDEKYQELHNQAVKMVAEAAEAYSKALSSLIQLEMWQKMINTVFKQEAKS